jgi:hypothetical protein
MHPDKNTYEYSIIRLVPRVERGECLNVGVIVFCKRINFLDLRIEINEKRITSAFPSINLTEIQKNLDAYQKICRGSNDGGPIASLDQPSRFRWLTAKRSTIIQSSEIHPGLTSNPEQTLDHLYQSLITNH